MTISGNDNKRKKTNRIRLADMLFLFLVFVMTACGRSENRDIERTEVAGMCEDNIIISSTDLNGGVWNETITNTEYGENKSPQLSWNKIKDAGCYAIIMIDPDGNNWLHWIETDIKENDISSGYSSNDRYIGPYPPAGTHHYIVYVYALKEPRDITSAKLDRGSNDINSIQEELSKDGNCLGYGMIDGTYTARH